jgi:SAM-dependent methyltransferase
MTNDQKQREYFETDRGFRTYNHPVVRFFATQRIEYIHTFLDLKAVSSALDVGCGSGFSTYYMQEYVPEIWAVDQSHQMLGQHPLKNTGRVSLANVLELPFADNSFDLVYGWEVLHHISKPSQAVAEMVRVSRQYVLIAEPNPLNLAQFLFALIDPEHRWVLRYTLAYMRNLCESTGLKVEHSSSGGWVFPNKTPLWLLPILQSIPYRSPLGISNWVLGCKSTF